MTIKPQTADPKWMRDIYLPPDAWSQPTDDCPDLDRLRAAAAGTLPLGERQSVLDHALQCRYCTESWRLALDLGVRPRLPPFWVHCVNIVKHDVELVAHLLGRLPRAAAWPVLATTVLAVAVLVVPEHRSSILRGAADKILGRAEKPSSLPRGSIDVTSQIAAGEALPRDAFVLRWATSAPHLVHRVEIRTLQGDVLHSAEVQSASSHQVPEVALRTLEPGTALEWSVLPVGPEGPLGSPQAFAVLVE